LQDLPFGIGGGLVAIKTLLGRDPCVHANVAIEMIDAILKEHPAAQPQFVLNGIDCSCGRKWRITDNTLTASEPAQRQWVGLTDDEKKNIFLKWYGKHWAYTKQVQSVMDSVEAKLKEKNT
jgi:hypothetical protein